MDGQLLLNFGFHVLYDKRSCDYIIIKVKFVVLAGIIGNFSPETGNYHITNSLYTELNLLE